MTSPNGNTPPTREDVLAIIREEKFVYQRMPLPHGLFTDGEDRSKTAELIFDDDLKGASVLDIGCCYGYFGYEAKRRNAGRVLGIEVNPSRYRQAILIRDLNQTDIELRCDNFFTVCEEESFDYVILLNVIHHLKEPVYALRSIAKCVRKRFIMEFPTFSDHKFSRGIVRFMAPFLNRMPYIGVSSLQQNDQTFIFTQRALQRILQDHDALYSSILFIPSPMAGRVIMICDK